MKDNVKLMDIPACFLTRVNCRHHHNIFTFFRREALGGIICVLLFFFTSLAVHAQTGLVATAIGAVVPGDYDGDGKLDLLVVGSAGGQPTSAVLRNLGNGSFTNISAPFSAVLKGTAAWGDYDNDGHLDLILSGLTSSLIPVCEVWHNQGNGTFSNANAGIPGLSEGSIAWGDYDNDGKLDVLVTGADSKNVYQTQLWHNQGNGIFSRVAVPFPGVFRSSVAWGDFDNDGNLDVLISGWNGTNAVTQLWRNLGNGTFTNMNIPFPGVYYSSVAWGDYDNDGKLDILLMGNNGTNPVAQIWRNMGNGVFSNIQANLTGVQQGVAAWGDYDNDGNLDALLTGADVNNAKVAQLYHNAGNNVFVATNTGLTALSSSSGGFGDFYGDGKLDIIISGLNSSGTIVAQLLHNTNTVTNNPPAMPANLLATPSSAGVTLSWSAPADSQTPGTGLSYNLRVGTSPGASDVMCADSSSATGFRFQVQRGNAGERTSVPLSLAPGIYYWSVQAVDTSFAGSPFAPEASFTLSAVVTTLPASQIAFTSATLGGMVNPRGAMASAWFQYGTSPAYGSISTPQSLGNGTNAININQTLPQLSVGTTYDFRAVASNQFGVSYGANQVFSTASNSPPTISGIGNISTTVSTPITPVAFTVSDAVVPASSLVLSAISSNPNLVPSGNLLLSGSGTNRTLAISPVSGQSGLSAITITAFDGVSIAVQSFVLTVDSGSGGSVPGDLNGDGIVEQNELDAVLSNYWGHSSWVQMTNVIYRGGGTFQFALTNQTGWNFSVMSSPDNVNWTVLTNQAIPLYQFSDPQAGTTGQKFYRLRYP